jgi:ribose transport system permease protein
MIAGKVKQIGESKKSYSLFTYSVYIVFAVLLIVFSLMSKSFLTFSNVYSTMLNGAPLILMTCAITYALLAGLIDLSVAAVGYAAGSICGIFIKNLGTPIWVAFLAGFLLALVLGGVNSLLIIKFKMNTLLTTLGMMLVIRGLGKIITRDRTILMGKTVSVIRQTKVEGLGGFPIVLFIVIAVVAISQIVLNYTKFGRHLIAVGCNEKAAQNVGINVQRIKTLALLTTSGICGIAGVVWVITLGAVITRGMNSYEFLAIASAVLGGTSLFGGRGSFFPGSFIGALILLFIADGLTIAGASPYVMPFIRGSIIFIAMYADSLRVRFE